MRLLWYNEFSCRCSLASRIYPCLFQAGIVSLGKSQGKFRGLRYTRGPTAGCYILLNVSGQNMVISVREMFKKNRREKKILNLGLLTHHSVFVLCQGVLFASFTGTNKIIAISPKERWQLATQVRDGLCSASHKINKTVKCVLPQQLSPFFLIWANSNDDVIKEVKWVWHDYHVWWSGEVPGMKLQNLSKLGDFYWKY